MDATKQAPEAHDRAAERPREQPSNMVMVQINGLDLETHRGKNSVEHLKHLGQVPKEDILSEIRDGKTLDLADTAVIEIHGGEVFISHKKLVTIKINNVDYDTAPGVNSVAHLRDLGKVPADEILSEFKGGQFVDLADNASVDIKGGEIFASHRPTGGSS